MRRTAPCLVGPAQTRQNSQKRALLLFFLRRLQVESMDRFKTSKVEHDKGKRAELKDKVRRLALSRPEYAERQQAKARAREQKRLVEVARRDIERSAQTARLAMSGKG